MLDFIFIYFAELWRTRNKRKIKNEDIYLQRESNQRSLTSQTGTLDRLATRTLLDDVLCLKVWHDHGIWIKSTWTIHA